jgi:cytidine deaminase
MVHATPARTHLARGARGYDAGMPDDLQELLEAADGVMRRAHAPYSNFKVGAALRGADGTIHVGANVENASYSQAQCAEASAIGAMIAAGETRITAIAVVAERVERCPPCGGCRQRLSEFAEPQTPVYLGRPGSEPLVTTLGELLPLSFGSDALNR